jgi:hypothetical protein
MLGNRAATLLLTTVTLLAATGCSGLTSAGLPSATTHAASSAGSGGSSSGAGITQATVSSTTVNFGSVTVGATITRQIQVTNTGTTSVTITENAASGAGFSASGIGSGLILQAAQAATLTISFTPISAGQVTGTVALASDAWSAPVIIELSGGGVEPTAAAHVASLAWDASSSVVAGYNAFRGTQSGGPYAQLNSSVISSTSYSDATVASGQTYFYVVTAVDSSGAESDYSNEVSATIP